MLEAIDYIFSVAKGKTTEDISNDKLLFFAVVKNIEIIGEAAYKLTESFKTRYNILPWPYIIKMRHVLVHDYYQISSKEVWKVINEDLEPLRTEIARFLTTIDWENWERNSDVPK